MTARRDLIGIGGSAGALPALAALLEAFRPAEPATLFVVIHRSGTFSRLVEIIQRATPYTVAEALDGEPVRPGRIYLAPADLHLLLARDHIHLRRGPRENNFRPAIDPMLRSLAVSGSGRAVGVVLSGFLDDGAAGLRAVAACGGLTAVQDPAEAQAPDMPRAAISALGEPTVIGPAAALGEALARIAAMPAPPPVEPPEKVLLELSVANLGAATIAKEDRLGEITPYNCPDCNGVLWVIEDGPMRRYRCHTGHAWSEGALVSRKDEMLERHLYETLRALRERVHMLETLAERHPAERERWLDRAGAYAEDADRLEAMIGRNPPLAAE